ncbi:VWFA domain-containing protein [Caenorhabditis elegans]|uniref:VWFA domain-containing protein n=1 Tax=Caenorhabditis elegans TaxID=6239 RepID=Q23565_CAEEL|nr:VWFA domain-containing protein [Caenorhabditis elegans]CAA88986.1 VWFA domain-containing protein [Caenorhabditis elegans]|eukprot:NP_496260.1 C-type LECtin [Caenorhabditis elegans]
MAMKFLLTCFLLGITFCLGSPVSQSSNCQDGYMDRVCGEDETHLWLDIVAVVDNSKGMTDKGVVTVAGQIVSLFVDGQQLGIDPNQPRTTRIGIVTYNRDATVVADLNKITSIDQLADIVFGALHKASSIADSYLHAGLEAADDLLQRQSFATSRGHYKKLVIVYASEYSGTGTQDPLPLATRMKVDVAIATVAYGQDNVNGFLRQLSQIATPGYNFTNQNGIQLVPELRATMVQVNCYCPNQWFQMRQSYSDESSLKYGVCIHPVTLGATRTAAKLSCRNQWNNAYMINEYTQTKHDFTLQVIENITAFTQPYTYYIGLSYSNGNWQWEQPNGQPLAQLQTWSDWCPGYPTASSTDTAVVNVQSSSSSAKTCWQNTKSSLTNMYVCEVATCDSTNYCTAEKI